MKTGSMAAAMLFCAGAAQAGIPTLNVAERRHQAISVKLRTRPECFGDRRA